MTLHDPAIGATINEYTLLHQIGSGAYGLVYLALNNKTHQQVAVKCIGKRVIKSSSRHPSSSTKHSEHLQQDLHQYFSQCQSSTLSPLSLNKIRDIDPVKIPCPFLREVSLQLQVQTHPGILKIHTILDSPVALFIVMDYYPEGDLFVNIVDRHVYTESSTLIKSVFTQLIDAVAYCHYKGIAHCDIKPENIMCADQGSRVVLADFGLAVQSDYIQAKTCIGSSYYMPPERLVNWNHDLHMDQYPAAKGDIWSMAVILINLCCTRNPWTKACEQDATYNAYKRDVNVLKEILNISDELFGILHDCLVEEPSERITLFELRERVLKCRAFTQTGPLAHCDDMDDDHHKLSTGLTNECVVTHEDELQTPTRSTDGLSSSDQDYLVLPPLHFLNEDFIMNNLQKYEPTVSMMTNASFNLNIV